MSVLVWDGKILAADKQTTNCNSARRTTKIWREGDKLLAAYGTFTQGMAMRNWVKQGMKPEEFPKAEPDIEAGFWVITKDGVLTFENSPHPIVLEDKYMAEGSGRDFAMGAMAMGANAIKAVEVASKFDIYCGGGVDWLTLGE